MSATDDLLLKINHIVLIIKYNSLSLLLGGKFLQERLCAVSRRMEAVIILGMVPGGIPPEILIPPEIMTIG